MHLGWGGVDIPMNMWDGQLTMFDPEDAPTAMQRSLDFSQMMGYDLSSVSIPFNQQESVFCHTDEDDEQSEENIWEAQKFSLEQFVPSWFTILTKCGKVGSWSLHSLLINGKLYCDFCIHI